MSDNSSLDSSDSDEYELARNSRTAIEELRNSPKKASISSSESIARESIASRLRNFQNKRRAQVVDAEDPQAATDSHGGVDEDKSDAYIIFESIAAAAHVSRKSILNMFGWRTSGVSEDGVGQVEETCVKGSGDVESKATVVEQTTETVTVKDVVKGNQKAVIPVSAPITKTPIGATKSNVVRTPTQNIPVDRKSTNKGAKAPSEMKASSSPVSNAKKPQVVARKVLVPSPDNREAIRRRIDSAKADKLPMHIVSSNIIKQTKASNPFSFADQNLAPI
jgi:parvulin-like peptidyl-prolyl isomerase